MKKLKNQKGITLVELLIGALMSLIIASAVLGFYLNQHEQWLIQEEISDMQQNCRATIDELTRYLRKAGYMMPLQTAYVIGGNSITVYFKDSTKVDTVQFYVSNTDPLHPNLMRKVNKLQPELFAENIETIQFVQAGTMIQLTLTARENTKDESFPGDHYRRRTIQSRIKLRNL